MSERRRLPVIQPTPSPKAGAAGGETSASGEDSEGAAPRPPWHWVGFGTVATFACWLPLAYVAEAIRHRVFASRFGPSPSRDQVDLAFAAMGAEERFRWTLVQTLPHVVAFALSAFAGGVLVGRFGAGAGPREAAASGLVTALLALAVSWRALADGGWGALASTLAPLLIAVSSAWWGGRLGARLRSK